MSSKQHEPEQVARVMELAAELLERDGWAQKGWSVYGRRCLVGALNRATRVELGLGPRAKGPKFSSLRNAAVHTLGDLLPSDFREQYGAFPVGPNLLITWNDESDREKQEVLDLLHKGAKKVQGVEV